MTMTEHPIFEAFAKLKIGFDEVKRAVQDQTDWHRMARRASTPVLTHIPFSAVASSAGFAVIKIGGPEQGRFWYVRSIAIGGSDPSVTTVTGRADIYVSGADLRGYTALSAIGMADWRDYTTTFPNVSFYGRGELPMRMNEKLYVVLSSSGSAQTIGGGIQIEEYQESAAQQDWVM